MAAIQKTQENSVKEMPRSTMFKSFREDNRYPTIQVQAPIRVFGIEGKANMVYLTLLFPAFLKPVYLIPLFFIFFLYLKRKRIAIWQLSRILCCRLGSSVCFPTRQEKERNEGVIRKWLF
ncbi:hypothetical protein P5U49_000209 [Neisseria gonorrhoeae]